MAGKGSFSRGRLKEAAKEDLGRPAPGEGHEAHAFLEVAVAGQEFESRLDEDLRIERDKIGLVAVDALVVGGVPARGFLPVRARDAGWVAHSAAPDCNALQNDSRGSALRR
jgi:hypothetical protein